MRDEAEKRIGHLYPKVEVTAELVKERPDLKPYVGQKLTVIAWLWAGTVKSPNPAFAQVDVPLVSTFMLATKPGKEAYVEPVIEGGEYRFSVRVGKPKNPEAANNGSKHSRGANFKCIVSGTPIASEYIRSEAKAGRMGARLMAIVAETDRGRVYLAPTIEHESAPKEAKAAWKPELKVPTPCHDVDRLPMYGMFTWGDAFSGRQLVALTTFSDLVQEAREQVKLSAVAAGLPDDDKPLRDGGIGATAYAEAVSVYCGLSVDKSADYNSSLVVWSPTRDQAKSTFARNALAMVWDYAEVNPLAGAAGDIRVSLEGMCKAVESFIGYPAGDARQQDAATQTISDQKVVSTDPPYYDNIGYADLSDFFYVWLRRSLRSVFPDLFATVGVPKSEELMVHPERAYFFQVTPQQSATSRIF